MLVWTQGLDCMVHVRGQCDVPLVYPLTFYCTLFCSLNVFFNLISLLYTIIILMSHFPLIDLLQKFTVLNDAV